MPPTMTIRTITDGEATGLVFGDILALRRGDIDVRPRDERRWMYLCRDSRLDIGVYFALQLGIVTTWSDQMIEDAFVLVELGPRP